MHDQFIFLDASFDQRASYTLVAWLRPRDAYVNIGESIAIIQDGDARRVITAPCSGRIVAVYADAGAMLLPRSLIATIRPGLPYTPQLSGLSTTIVAVALIGATVVLLPVLKEFIQMTRTAPLQPTAIVQVTPSTVAVAPTDVAPPAETAVATTPTPETPPEAVAPVGTQRSITTRISLLLGELVNLCNEIRPWAQRNTQLNQQISDYMIGPRSDRRNQINQELSRIVDENNAAPELSNAEAQLLSQINTLVEPCNIIFDEILNANSMQSIPRDLSAEYDQCNAATGLIQQYQQP